MEQYNKKKEINLWTNGLSKLMKADKSVAEW